MPSIYALECDNREWCSGYAKIKYFSEYHGTVFNHCGRCASSYRRDFLPGSTVVGRPEITAEIGNEKPKRETVPDFHLEGVADHWFLDPLKGGE